MLKSIKLIGCVKGPEGEPAKDSHFVHYRVIVKTCDDLFIGDKVKSNEQVYFCEVQLAVKLGLALISPDDVAENIYGEFGEIIRQFVAKSLHCLVNT